jgi:hypothetical protein
MYKKLLSFLFFVRLESIRHLYKFDLHNSCGYSNVEYIYVPQRREGENELEGRRVREDGREGAKQRGRERGRLGGSDAVTQEGRYAWRQGDREVERHFCKKEWSHGGREAERQGGM